MGPENETAVTEFILEGFSGLDQRLQWFFSLVVLLTYLTTVMGNATIIFLVRVDHHLQTPMYFFISNLAFLGIWFTSCTSIKLFVILSSDQKTLSLSSCLAPNYFCFALGCTEFVLLVVMSCDRSVAICQPLLCADIMKPQLCVHLVVAAWVLNFALLSYRLLFLSKLSFSGSKTPHFPCDSSPLLKLSCSDTSLLWKIDSVFRLCVVLRSLCLTLAFYICILCCVLHLPAASGRKNAFTACSSHLITLSIACGSCIALRTCPSEDVSLKTNRRIVALLNTVLYPFLNPFIYSLRNKTVIVALNKFIAGPRIKLFP